MSAEQKGMFSREWYNEYFRRAAFSAAHSQFCEKVYGKDLCQHGLMDMNELDFLISLIEPQSKILDIGCSNGYITEYIHNHTHSTVLGLDYSDVAIEQARERTKDRAGTLQFAQVDLTLDEIPGSNYDYIIMIDSIYFLGKPEEAIKRISQKVSASGKMMITYFQVREDETEGALSPERTHLGEALRLQGFEYEWYEFTENVRLHGMKNYEVGEALRDAFEKEGNGFLYEARIAENRFFKESVEKNTIVRYLYVVGQAKSASAE